MPKPSLAFIVVAVVSSALIGGIGVKSAAQKLPTGPQVDKVRGHVTGNPPQELRPLTVRTGEDLQTVGQVTTTDAPRIVTVYAEVNGRPVVLSFEVDGQSTR